MPSNSLPRIVTLGGMPVDLDSTKNLDATQKGASAKRRAADDCYRFGLRVPRTRAWIEAEWRQQHIQDRDRFIRETVLQPGPHILPYLKGDPDTCGALRRHHLACLLEVFGEATLINCVRSEIDPLLNVISDDGREVTHG